MGALNSLYFFLSQNSFFFFFLYGVHVSLSLIRLFFFSRSVSLPAPPLPHSCFLAGGKRRRRMGWNVLWGAGLEARKPGPKEWVPSPSLHFSQLELWTKRFIWNRSFTFNKNRKPSFPITKVLCSYSVAVFSREHLTCSLSAQEATLSLSPQMNQKNSLKRQDPTDRGLISFVCTCVLWLRNHYYLSIDWGHSLLFFTTTYKFTSFGCCSF